MNTRNRPISVDELRTMTDTELAAHRTDVAHTVATISADLHAHMLGGTHTRTDRWLSSATYARDKHRATIEAINGILAERTTATGGTAVELLAAAIVLLETDPDDDPGNDAAFERLSRAVDACTTGTPT